jgi:hypothetical protein
VKGRVQKRTAPTTISLPPDKAAALVLFRSPTRQDMFGRQEHPQFLDFGMDDGQLFPKIL